MKKIIRTLLARIRLYWALIKSLQTGLLLITGIAGFGSVHCPVINLPATLALSGSLFLAIGGTTILNMVYDRDIDAKMARTARRPIPAGLIPAREALVVGLVLAGLGVGWALIMYPLYGLVVFAGVFFNTVVYTVWLKRRTPWSIVWGGIAGAMPILAGRVLGTGQFDLVGLLLAMAVLFWIPTHIITFSFRQAEDYKRAGVPVFPNCYGERTSYIITGVSTAIAVLCLVIATGLIGLDWSYLRVIITLGIILIGFAVLTMYQHSDRYNFILFKTASLYMLMVMLLMMVGLWDYLQLFG